MSKQRAHRCDTETPQRPCCWAARKAELDAMEQRDRSGATAKAQAEHAAKLQKQAGFVTRGLD